jgi:hypothetical protein
VGQHLFATLQCSLFAGSAVEGSLSAKSPVRLYCRFVGYDLETPNALHNMTGNPGYNEQERQLVLDAVYVFLRADRHRGESASMKSEDERSAIGDCVKQSSRTDRHTKANVRWSCGPCR